MILLVIFQGANVSNSGTTITVYYSCYGPPKYLMMFTDHVLQPQPEEGAHRMVTQNDNGKREAVQVELVS